MTALATLGDVGALYAARGGLRYGEGVTQLEHALQCAALAEAGGGSPSVVAAALLHDVGHLLMDEERAAATANDERHESRGARALGGLFGPDVRAPIALHVAAKRYLCLREPAYLDALSAASRRSLDRQGGVFGQDEADAFERLSCWRDAVALRRCDDSGKAAQRSLRGFADYLPLLASLLTKPAGA